MLRADLCGRVDDPAWRLLDLDTERLHGSGVRCKVFLHRNASDFQAMVVHNDVVFFDVLQGHQPSPAEVPACIAHADPVLVVAPITTFAL